MARHYTSTETKDQFLARGGSITSSPPATARTGISLRSTLDDFQQRRSQAAAWAKAADKSGANIALTLNPDLYGSNLSVARGKIDGICKKLFRALNHEVFGLSLKEAERRTSLWFLGIYELRDRRLLIYPHGHFAIRWEGDVDVLRDFLANRWAALSPTGEWGPALVKPVDHKLTERLHQRPQWDVATITNTSGWMNYIRKQMEPDMTSNLEVFPLQFIRKEFRATARAA